MPGHKPTDEATLKTAYESVGLPFDKIFDLYYIEYLRSLGFRPGTLHPELIDALSQTVLRLKKRGNAVLQRFEKTGNTPSLSELADAWLLPRQRFGLLNHEFTALKPMPAYADLVRKPVDALSKEDLLALKNISSIGPQTIRDIAALSFVFTVLKQLRQSPEAAPPAREKSETDLTALFRDATKLSLRSYLQNLKTPCDRKRFSLILKKLGKY